MKKFGLCLLFLSITSVVYADPSPIILPDIVPAPQPIPANAATKLYSDQLFVIRSNTSCVVLCSPLGTVKITQEVGPIRIRGKFVDGTGTETRNFTEKNVWIVEAAVTGRCELLIIPSGATTEKDVTRRTLDVDAGEGPRPPPTPPVPPDDPIARSFQMGYDLDTDANKAVKLATLISIMDEAANQAKSQDVKTIKQLIDVTHAVADAKVGVGAIKSTRGAVGAYLNATLPRADTNLTDELRSQLSVVYLKTADALRKVKP